MDFGTLLGALRNGRIIPWDTDGDIGVLAKEKEKILALKGKIEADGFGVYLIDDIIQITYSYLNWNYCDLWLHDVVEVSQHKQGVLTGDWPDVWPADLAPNKHREQPKGKELICATGGFRWDHTWDFPYWFVKEMEQKSFAGKKINCPRHPYFFIKMRYGADWKIPVKKGEEGVYWGGNAFPLSKSIDYIRKHR